MTGNRAAEEILDHLEQAAEQVPQIIGEVGVYPVDERLFGVMRILTERHLPHQEVTQGVGTELLDEWERIHNVAGGFRHLGVRAQPPSMSEDGLWQRQTGGHEKRRPVD